jgi:hypothetical protein
MTTAEPTPVFRWSFSQWENYNSCPARWKYKSVLKVPGSPPGPAAARGLDIHASVEEYILGKIPESELHTAVKKKFIPVLDAFRNHPNGDRYCEKKLGFDADWYLCSPMSKTHTACVAVLDAVRYTKKTNVDEGFLHIGEWKSGKPKDTHRDQRLLYAMFGWKAWKPTRVEVTTYYLEDTGPPQRTTLQTEEGYEKLKGVWNDRIALMQRDQFCAPRPGIHCNWCDYAKKKGGPCAFGG